MEQGDLHLTVDYSIVILIACYTGSIVKITTVNWRRAMFLISLTSQITQKITKCKVKKNIRVVLYFKDKFALDYMKEFICLKPKLYSITSAGNLCLIIQEKTNKVTTNLV